MRSMHRLPTLGPALAAAMVAAALWASPGSALQQPAGERLQKELSILDSLDGYIFDARQAEATRIRTAGYLAAALKRLEKATTDLEDARKVYDEAR